MAPPFTIPTPQDVPVTKRGEHWYLEAEGREVRLSNLHKVFWPDQGYTKGDLLAYYYNVAGLILPYLESRPLTMRRMPDGVTGHEFYEKNAPSHTPDWMPRCRAPSSESSGGAIDYLMVDGVSALLYVANLGCIEFHPLHSQCDHLDLPDYLFFDLDPHPPIDFEDVIAVAHHVVTALDALELPWYAKTSGKNGMQIYVPIELGPTYEEVRGFVTAIGRAIRDADPQRTTLEPNKANRAGKVYIDANMNRAGANIAAVYSLRPRIEATASTPLTRAEIEEGLARPEHFTMANVHERYAELGDLFAGMLTDRIDLFPTLEQLGLRIQTPGDVEAKLATYDAKRDFSVTPEPRRGPASSGNNRFVIQKHAATRLHYDLRLERDGVLVSWAVPRGLPTQPGERRLAVHTEDHPMSYLDFEAWIPKGEYGGGEMRIFDTGTYEAPEWESNKITIRLHGERVRGEYHLVETKQGWLIFLSKRSTPLAPPPPIEPMMAEGGHDPFSDPAWVFEPKLDGVRTLAYVSTDLTRLLSRTGRDQTAQYPELGNLATYVNALHAVLDGEIVAMGDDGHPSFAKLQQRINLSSETEIARIRQAVPVTISFFDILWLDDRDLCHEPWEERRRILEETVTETGPVSLTLTVQEDGRSFFEAAKELRLEGIIAKRRDSVYEPGRRSRHWRKIKAMKTIDAVVIGWTPGTGSRGRTFGALLLGAYEDGMLRWIGQVGTGFSGELLRDIVAQLEGLETTEPPIDDRELHAVRGARWVRPELVAEVTYLEITKAGRLRAPSFKGFRPDTAPGDCLLESAGA